MRIAHVISYFQPEFGYHETFVPREQAAMGHEVHLITSDRIFPFHNVEKMLSDIGSPYKDRMRPVGDSMDHGVHIHRNKTNLEMLFDIIYFSNVKEHLRRIKPDVVHAHGVWQWGSFQAARLKEELGFRLIVDEHAYWTTYDMRPTLRNWALDKEYRILRAPYGRYTLKRADGIVGIIQETVDFVEDLYNVSGVHLVPLGIDHRRFVYNEKARKMVRKEMGLKDDDIFLLSAGRLESAKRLEFFIDGFKKVKADNLRFFIAGRGDDDYLEKLKGMADDRIEFLGFASTDRLADLYSAADIGIWGKASITIREAMSCNLPVILFDDRNMQDLLQWDNGIAVGREPEMIADAIRKLANDPEERARMGKNGRKGVEEEFSSEVEAKRLIEIYQGKR